MTEAASVHEAVGRLVKEELDRFNPGTFDQLVWRGWRQGDVAGIRVGLVGICTSLAAIATCRNA